MCHSEDTLEYQQSRINAKLSTSVQYDFTAISSNIALEVNKMSMKQRNCKFRENGSLKTWPIYSARMCLIECRHQIIIQYCRCLPHFARPIGMYLPLRNCIYVKANNNIAWLPNRNDIRKRKRLFIKFFSMISKVITTNYLWWWFDYLCN